MLESTVESRLCDGVVAAGGEVRKTKWINRRHAPDQRVMHPKLCCWIEVKRPGEKPRPGQKREHERMTRLGEQVFVISTIEEVDTFLEKLK